MLPVRRLLQRSAAGKSAWPSLLVTGDDMNGVKRGFRSSAPVERHPVMIGLLGMSIALTAHYTLRAHRRLQAQKEAEPFERATMVLGLDVGLTNTRLAGLDTNEGNENTIATEPTSVQIRSGEVIVGALAVKNSVRRLRDELQHDRPLVQLGVDADETDPSFKVDSMLTTLLGRLHDNVASALEKDEHDVPCVVALPTEFGDAEKDRLRAILTEANMHVLGYLREPVAAMFASNDWDETFRNAVVFDMGGVESRCSVLDCSNPEAPSILSTQATESLSGEVLDEAIIDVLATDFERKNNINLRTDSLAMDRLRDAAESAKKELSTAKVSHINLPFITADQKGAKHLEHALSQSTLQRLTFSSLEKSFKLIASVLHEAKLEKQDIDAIIFCGGGMKAKYIQSEIATFLEHPTVVDVGNEEDAVVRGALKAGQRYWYQKEMKD
ncbi:chaperone protein DnaK [Thraustotheca clavata]|uniref:Chaperone protein DnaK n=1 Tax=Thraustotheca clavata TaxID=74557 RepID=A0A1W0A662_9STRA|nr:chaperone protein DnaK [Thraustotheca clavata]